MNPSDILSPFGPGGPEKPPKPSVLDYVTKLVVPVLALVALIATQSRSQKALTWFLLGFAFLSLLAGFYPQVAPWIRHWRQAWRDAHKARRAFPQLREFVGRFETFVTANSGLALHEAILNEFGRNVEMLAKFGIPPAQLFWGFWSDLNRRVTEYRPTLSIFEATVSEFGMLVSEYNNYCMQVVFRQLPQDLRDKLTDRSKSALNASRESFNEFLSAYEAFLQGLDGHFAERHVPIRNFSRVKPL